LWRDPGTMARLRQMTRMGVYWPGAALAAVSARQMPHNGLRVASGAICGVAGVWVVSPAFDESAGFCGRLLPSMHRRACDLRHGGAKLPLIPGC
jgi:hypothetical protein